MKKYILIDTYNLFFRALYTITDPDMNVCNGMMLHLLFSMIKKACDKFNPDCLIACRDGFGNWRKSVYPQYKANRIEKLNERTPYEIQRGETLLNTFENTFLPFLKDKTNIPVLGYNNVEADDIISRFIDLHPNDVVIILSTDNDFVQLLTDNVFIYNSMEERIISNKAVMNVDKMKPLYFTLKDGKISVPKAQPDTITELTPYNDWVEYALFTKCVRGDRSDNIFSAYPGVREKSSSKKVGMRDAFLDRNDKGYNWNNFMNSTWTDAFGKEHIVKEDYELNKSIIDLKMLSEDKKKELNTYISEELNKEPKSCVGISLEKFFKQWNLMNLEQSLTSFSKYFQRSYNM